MPNVLSKSEARALENGAILQSVCDLVEKGHNVVSACQATSDRFGVHSGTIRTRYYRHLEEKEKIHGNRLLTILEEQGILGAMLAFAATNKPLTVKDVAKIIQEVTGASSDFAGIKTARRLVDEHSELLRLATTKALAPKRKGAEMLSSVDKWIAIYRDLLEGGRYSSKNIVLYDETGAGPSSDKSPTKRIVLREAPKAQHQRGKTGKPLGVLPFATAAGEPIMVVYILPLSEVRGQKVARDLYVQPSTYSKRGGFESVYIFTDKGKIDGEAWTAIAQEFERRWHLIHAGLDCLLIGDSLSPHLNVNAVRYLAERGIQKLFLAKNTTHFTQVFDNWPYGLFKKRLTPAIDQEICLTPGDPRPMKEICMKVVPRLLDEVFTPEILRAASKNVGIWPFDGDLIRNLAEENNADPQYLSLPEESVAGLVFSSVKKLINTEDRKTVTVRVSKGQMYTSDQILAEYQLQVREKEEKVAHQKRKAEELDESRKKRRTEAIDLGNKRLESRRRGIGIQDGENWTDDAWVRHSSCHFCRTTGTGGKWKGTECESIWFCRVCKPLGEELLKEHEQSCRICLQILGNVPLVPNAARRK